MIKGQAHLLEEPTPVDELCCHEFPNLSWCRDGDVVIGFVEVLEFDGEELVPDPWGPMPVVVGQTSNWMPDAEWHLWPDEV